MNPQEPVGNPITRRNFMKKTAFTAAAITILAQGVSMAADSGSGSYTVYVEVTFGDS